MTHAAASLAVKHPTRASVRLYVGLHGGGMTVADYMTR